MECGMRLCNLRVAGKTNGNLIVGAFWM